MCMSELFTKRDSARIVGFLISNTIFYIATSLYYTWATVLLS